MPERQQGNRTERLQARLRNYRWRDLFGSHAFRRTRPSSEPIASGTIIQGDSERRAKYLEEAKTHKRILDRALALSIEGKSAAEVLDDLDLPSHSILPDTKE